MKFVPEIVIYAICGTNEKIQKMKIRRRQKIMAEGLIVVFALIGTAAIMYACCCAAGKADDEKPIIHSEVE